MSFNFFQKLNFVTGNITLMNFIGDAPFNGISLFSFIEADMELALFISGKQKTNFIK